MVAASATVARMGKKKPTDEGKKPHGRSPNYTVFARVPPELGEALEAYISSLRPRPSMTAVLTSFIEDGLAKVGFWPAGGSAGQDD